MKKTIAGLIITFALCNFAVSADKAKNHIKGAQQNFYSGISAGAPFLIGLKFEYILNRNDDTLPSYIITSDIGVTCGYAASIAIEKRLGRSSFYAGCGYNFTRIAFGVSAGDLGAGVNANLHSALITIGYRSPYRKSLIKNMSFGLLLNPSEIKELPVVPVLKFSILD